MLTAILDYVQGDREWEDFLEYVLENGTPELTNSEVRELARAKGDRQQELLEKAASNPNENHIWAIAHRVRRSIETPQRYLIQVHGCVEPRIHGPYVNEKSLDRAAKYGYRREDAQFRLTIKGGKPKIEPI